jgi:hypothetical protein
MQRTVTLRQSILALALTASLMLLITMHGAGIAAPVPTGGSAVIMLSIIVVPAMFITLASTLRAVLNPDARAAARARAKADAKRYY